MLEKIDFLSRDTAALIIYTNSAVLQTLLKKRIKERFEIAKNLTKYANTGATLKEARNETFTPPFGGGTWLVDIQADKINIGDIAKYLNNITNASVSIIWYNNYAQFKKVIELDAVKKLGIYCFTMYTGKLYPEDISYIQNMMLPEEKRLPKKLVDYLKKNYTFDVDSVCKIFQAVSQGEEISSTKDIINKVGIGGNTIDSFVIKLLTTNPKTEKGLKSAIEKSVVLLNDLSYSYDYRSIKNFMKNCLNTIIEIKQLQMMGLYSEAIKDIPETSFHSDKIQRMKRYDGVILNDLNMGRILNLSLCLDRFDDFNSEIALLKAIYAYLLWTYKKNEENPTSKEMAKKTRWR